MLPDALQYIAEFLCQMQKPPIKYITNPALAKVYGALLASLYCQAQTSGDHQNQRIGGKLFPSVADP